MGPVRFTDVNNFAHTLRIESTFLEMKKPHIFLAQFVFFTRRYGIKIFKNAEKIDFYEKRSAGWETSKNERLRVEKREQDGEGDIILGCPENDSFFPFLFLSSIMFSRCILCVNIQICYRLPLLINVFLGVLKG